MDYPIRHVEFLRSKTRLVVRVTADFYLDLDQPDEFVRQTIYFSEKFVPGTPYKYPIENKYVIFGKSVLCPSSRGLEEVEAAELLTHDSPEVRKAIKLYLSSSLREFEEFCMRLNCENITSEACP